jgi:hypothetical protein
MTNAHHNFRRVVTLAAVFLAVLACTVVVRAVAQTSPSISTKELKTLSISKKELKTLSISKKELKTLLATAKTPADQERLAAYYRDKAQQLRAKAQEFSAQADSMAGLPLVLESKRGIGCQCAFHYRYFSKLYAQQAKDAEVLAAQHNQLAQDYQSKAAQQ